MIVEDRLAIEAAFIAYCAAIDGREDARAAAGFYTDDGVMDNSALGAPLVEGREALAVTISGMFTSMARLEHYISNFLLTGDDADTASAQCYVQAFGQPKGGDGFSMRGKYAIEFRRVASEWKIARLSFFPFG